MRRATRITTRCWASIARQTSRPIKKAYRKRALETHPDQGGKKEDFAEVAEAYEILSDPQKKQVYDQYGSEAANQSGMHGGMGGYGGGHRSAEDIFSEFFRGAGMGGFGDMFGMGGGGGMNRGPPTVEPQEVRVRLTLEEVYKGVVKTLTVNRPQVCTQCDGHGTKSKKAKEPCAQCGGSGHVVQQTRMDAGMVRQTITGCPRCQGTGTMAKAEDQCGRCSGRGYRKVSQQVSVEIPAGVPPNVTLVVRGEGGAIPGAQPGDLHVHIEIQPHSVFERRGDDLIVRRNVTLAEALLGLQMPLKLLDGRTVHIKTGEDTVLKPNGVIKLVGEGMPTASGGRGDIYVFATLSMPTKLTEAQRDHIKKAFGIPKEDPNASPGNTVKARVLRETREQLEQQKRGVWEAANGGNFGGGASSRRARSNMGGGQTAECATQ
ncbi:molecular chaperone DnaJ [Strigomonas culicis]|uniref:Molecular chaperone DnaJ n=1 Tax=Strigomonas culicis TaxID=28005 RepID=S9V8N1_9TRYP|nr:molecular chaperone DnaJ [Strigomonas culicis]|eukprot:EPY19310.1 molecular chaperone DnaJ [Strigomonas culicis]